MANGKNVSEDTKIEIIRYRNAHQDITYAALAEHFGLSISAVRNAVLNAQCNRTVDELDAIHKQKMDEKDIKIDSSKWMENVTPLHKQKLELERKVRETRKAYEKANAEYRNFIATVRGLGEDNV